MIRVLKWASIGLGGLFILMVLAILLLPQLVNLDKYRGILANRVSKVLGREVKLGSVRVDLWGGIGAEAKGIQIAQAPGFGTEPFVAANALRVHVRFLPLLRGQLRVSTAILDEPRIRLVHTQDGRWSIDDLIKASTPPSPTKPPAEAGRPGKAPLLGGLFLNEVAVKNGQITLLDQARSPGLTLTVTDLMSPSNREMAPIPYRSGPKLVLEGSDRAESSRQERSLSPRQTPLSLI